MVKLADKLFQGDIFFLSIILFFCISFLVTFFWKVKTKKSCTEENAFSKDESTALKGMAALMIFLAHTQTVLADYGYTSIVLKPFSVFGGMGVLVFFFLSGYGIGKGYCQKEPTVRYWKNRIIKVLVPACIISFLFQTAIFLISKGSLKTFVRDMLEGQWYIDVIMLCYLCFFISWVIAYKKQGLLLALTAVLCLVCGCVFFILKFNPRWYNGIMLFPVGLVFSAFEKKLTGLSKKAYILIGILSFLLFCIPGGLFVVLKGLLLADMMKTLSGIGLCILAFVLLRFFKVGNVLSFYLGKRSLFIYLCHLWLIKVIEALITKNTWFENHITADFYIILVGALIITEIFYRLFELKKARK
ncbi:MAG: acyltransferase [Lachnospiraceae bacterium]|nr:acyltransferase [Lachnospiraceae bacterium]